MNLLGVDFGTTSLKATVFNEKGEQLSFASEEYTLITKGDCVEFCAEHYWEIFQRVIDKTTDGLDICALSIDTQCETMILADENGIPLRNAIVWLDNRATEEAKEIEEAFGTKMIYEVTGQPEVTATWPACKLLWLKKNEPEIWEKTKKIFLLEDYLLHRLTGKFVTEKTLQSSSLYFDIRKGVWWEEMLDFIGISKDMLPCLHNSAEIVGYHNKTAVVTGVMDQIAGAIGAGVTENNTISEMTGTTMVIFANSDEIPPYDVNSKIPCHYNFNGKYCLMLWTPTAGMVLKWFKNNFCESLDFYEMDKLTTQIPPGCDGLVMLPHLSGSTMPKYNPYAKGNFYGVTLAHNKGHFIRSIYEAVACMLKENLDYSEIEISEIRAMGGGANSEIWCQIKADMTGKRLVTLKNKETACLGSAIIAGVGAGVFGSVSEACEKAVGIDKMFIPSGTDYSKVYEKYCKLDELMNHIEL